MGEILNRTLKMKISPPLREEVSLNLALASSILRDRFEKIAEPFGITTSQYNVLRILKGVYPDGHARCEIIKRMFDRAPDITRLIDRLEKQGLVKRDRTSKDRRMSITKITERGLKVISDLQPIIDKEHKDMTKSLTDAQCRELSVLIEKLYENLI